MTIFLIILLALLVITGLITSLWSKEILRAKDPSTAGFYTSSVFVIFKMYKLAEAQTDLRLKQKYNRLATITLLVTIFFPIVVLILFFNH